MHKIITSFLIFFCPVVLWSGEMPLCIYGVNTPEDVQIVKQAGFNCIQSYELTPDILSPLAKEASKQGVKVLFYPNKIMGSEFLKEAQSWPFLALYLYDEPDVRKKTNAELKELDQQAKLNFPGKKTAFVVGKGSHLKDYYDTADIVMVDWYPVPHLALTSFGWQIKEAKEILKKGGLENKPLWGVLQSFDWRHYNQHRPEDKRLGRFPTVSEMRFMAYHGIFEGMDGILFYAYTFKKAPMPKTEPENWQKVVSVSTELKAMLPVFESGTISKAPFKVKAPLALKRWLYEGNYYDILLNLSGTPQKLPRKLKNKKYTLIYGTLGKTLMPYDALVFKSGVK